MMDSVYDLGPLREHPRRDNQYQPTRIHRVQISRVEDDERGFEELPPNAFDRSDRKFLAVAVVANATVVNATDSDWDEDWNESAALMSSLGVEVRQLCPQHATKQAQRERPR